MHDGCTFFDQWHSSDGFELVGAEDEEAFENDVVPFEVIAGDEEEEGEGIPIIAEPPVKKWVTAIETGNTMHKAMEQHFLSLDRGFDTPVEIHFRGKVFEGRIQELSFNGHGQKDMELSILGFEKKGALPPVNQEKLNAALGTKPKDWRMFYDNSSARRKDQPVTEGFLDYFPAAVRLCAELSRLGNEKHNPGEPLHHARSKSTDHRNCAVRHTMDADVVDEETNLIEAVGAFWRLGAYIQEKCEKDYGWPRAPRAKD